MTTPLAGRIAAANAEVMNRIAKASPVWTGVREARAVIPALADRVLLHAGPPTTTLALCGPMRGAAIGAILFEGWARNAEEAVGLLERGGVALRCTHDHDAVGPMAGIISPSMPVLEVRDHSLGTVAYCPLNEGVGTVLRFGAHDETVIARLWWMRDILAPALHAALQRAGPIPLLPLMARAVIMGDEMHQRNVAATGLFYRTLAPVLAESHPSAPVADVLRFLSETDQFFLNVAMAACKAMMDACQDLPYSTVVTAMSRNGVEFGIRVSGLGKEWFTSPAPVPEGLYFPGHGAADANPDMGDSAIVETAGLGGFAMAAAPAVVGFVGLPSAREAIAATRKMREITVGQSPHFKIPALDFEGTPTGIDIRRVVELDITPIINTGIAHREAGIGQIGAGVVRAPLEVFEKALDTFAERFAAR